jgi:bacillopeptidase F
VASSSGGTLLDATVTTGIFTTQSNPVDGSYELLLPAGTYDITASADGYGSHTVSAVTVAAGPPTTLDFMLQPYETVVFDDVEAGPGGWTAEGQWAITAEASASPTHSWTDSPGADYGDNWNYSLISPVFDLFEIAGVVLEFSHIYELESGYDYGIVEVSADGGSSWTPIASYDGFQTGSWQRVELAVPGLDNTAEARIRFRLDSDVWITEDGWHIDDIMIRGFAAPPDGLIFRSTFETGDTSNWSAVAP